MKKIIALLLTVVLTATAAIGGTLAYLTDRDSEVNTFTSGNVTIDLIENFDKDNAKLVPGTNANGVKKETFIKNSGDEEAYVWMTMAIPAALDDNSTTTVGEKNALHWNVPGAVWNGYHTSATDAKITTAKNNGWITDDHIDSTTGKVKNDCVWTICQTENAPVAIKQETIDGVEYNVYTFLYNGTLTENEQTTVALHQVYLDSKIDIDTAGNWYLINNGTAESLNWTNNNTIKVIVSAYGIQASNVTDVNSDNVIDVVDAYKLYNSQWGTNGTEYTGSAT